MLIVAPVEYRVVNSESSFLPAGAGTEEFTGPDQTLGSASAVLPVVLLGVLLASFIAPPIVRLAKAFSGLVLAAVPAAAGIALWSFAPRPGQAPLVAVVDWIPSLGARLSLRLDGLAILFVLIVLFVGVSVFVYAGSYLRKHTQRGRFFSYLLLFVGAMVGVALADNLLLLYVCWELTSISSWLLIGFEHEKAEARKAAWQSLMVTTAGGLALLAGLILLAQTTGTYRISEILSLGAEVRRSGAYTPALFLFFFAAATKSALVPFHFWLPAAMAAPTPVSAYLHSAAMVKAGIYLLARFSPALGGTPTWTILLTAAGALTAVAAAALALVQTDSKRLLAYSTVSALGMMTLALGVGGPHGVRAALAVLLAHALYKGALFMVAGAVDHGAHTRDLRQIGGLWRVMPLTSAAALIAMVSMIGLPPSLGFIGEEELIKVPKSLPGSAADWLMGAVFVSGALYSGVGFVIGARPTTGRTRAPKTPHEPAAGLWLPPLALAALGVILALVPGSVDKGLISPAVASAAGRAPEEHLALWHGATPSFWLGIAMIAIGAVLAAAWNALRSLARRLAFLGRFGAKHAYEAFEKGLLDGATQLDRRIQHGYLPGYLFIVGLAVLLFAGPFLLRAGLQLPSPHTPFEVYDFAIVAVMIAGTAGAIGFESRLATIASMTLVGYAVAVYFAIFGAPDLAITQVLVETLLAVLLVFALPSLPRFSRMATTRSRVRDILLSTAVGGLVCTFLLSATARDREATASNFYIAESEATGGANVVNIIIVVFRAADTLGEVTVLAAAALGVVILLTRAEHE